MPRRLNGKNYTLQRMQLKTNFSSEIGKFSIISKFQQDAGGGLAYLGIERRREMGNGERSRTLRMAKVEACSERLGAGSDISPRTARVQKVKCQMTVYFSIDIRISVIVRFFGWSDQAFSSHSGQRSSPHHPRNQVRPKHEYVNEKQRTAATSKRRRKKNFRDNSHPGARCLPGVDDSSCAGADCR